MIGARPAVASGRRAAVRVRCNLNDMITAYLGKEPGLPLSDQIIAAHIQMVAGRGTVSKELIASRRRDIRNSGAPDFNRATEIKNVTGMSALDYDFLCHCCQQAYQAAPTWGAQISCDAGTAVALVGDVLIDGDTRAKAVVFRGSLGVKDWLLDAMLERTPFGDGCVHRGFLREWGLIRDDVVAAIGDSDTVVFAGHSSGGAIACIAAIDPAVTASRVCVATLAAPAAGDAAAAEQMRARIARHVRVQVAQDIVPRLLPRFLGYAQSGELISEVSTRFAGWSPLARIKFEHAIDTYQSAGVGIASSPML